MNFFIKKKNVVNVFKQSNLYCFKLIQIDCKNMVRTYLTIFSPASCEELFSIK